MTWSFGQQQWQLQCVLHQLEMIWRRKQDQKLARTTVNNESARTLFVCQPHDCIELSASLWHCCEWHTVAQCLWKWKLVKCMKWKLCHDFIESVKLIEWSTMHTQTVRTKLFTECDSENMGQLSQFNWWQFEKWQSPNDMVIQAAAVTVAMCASPIGDDLLQWTTTKQFVNRPCNFDGALTAGHVCDAILAMAQTIIHEDIRMCQP